MWLGDAVRPVLGAQQPLAAPLPPLRAGAPGRRVSVGRLCLGETLLAPHPIELSYLSPEAPRAEAVVRLLGHRAVTAGLRPSLAASARPGPERDLGCLLAQL